MNEIEPLSDKVKVQDMETLDRPIDIQIDFHAIDAKTRDGTSYYKISKLEERQNSASGNPKLKISSQIDFANTKVDMNVLKRGTMRSRKDERVRLLGQNFK